MNPSSEYCQRWREGRHSWRHRREGGFDPATFRVVPLEERIARRFVERHHYAGTYPAARLAFGLTTSDERLLVDGTIVGGRALVGVAVLSVPMQAGVLTGVFPDLEPYSASLELGRFVLTDTPANAESWMIARVFDLAAEAGVRGVVSFADPMPRQRMVTTVDRDGIMRRRREVLTPGHVGVIYQAANGRACGRSTPRTLNYLPEHGLVLSARTLSKIRAQESGAAAAERQLVRLGARERTSGEDPRAWLRQALEDLRVEKVRHPGNFRYAWALGSRRSRARIALASTPFPKAATALLPLAS